MSLQLALAFARTWILQTIEIEVDHALLYIDMSSIQDQAYRFLLSETPHPKWFSYWDDNNNILIFELFTNTNVPRKELELHIYEGQFNAVVSIHEKNGELWNDQGIIIWNWHCDNKSCSPGYVVNRINSMSRIL
jgi:hypothetical protein